jgi:prepilin-type N-terminal cleavage/methylation domain-containing protein
MRDFFTASSAGLHPRAERGMTMIETVIAIMLLAVAASGLLGAFDASRREASYSEKQTTGTAIADEELQRITSQPWKKIALKSGTWTANSSSPTDPTSYLSAGPCDEPDTLPAHSPCYQYDWTGTAKEPLVTSSSEYDETADPYPFETLTPGKATRISGNVYRYITWVDDSKCKTQTKTCGNSGNYKRITVAVVVTGLKAPVVVSSLYANPEGGTENPLVEGATCLDGEAKVSCTH